ESQFQTSVTKVDDGNGLTPVGTLTIDATGAWNYEIDNTDSSVQSLAEGETRTETFQVLSEDGTTHNIVVTITGTDDEPVIGGTSYGEATEDNDPQIDTDGNLFFSSQATISDADDGEGAFVPASVTPTVGNFVDGSLTIDAAGNWSYLIPNDSNNVQGLAEGERATQTFTVQTIDGTEHTIVVDIVGVNDDSVLISDPSQALGDVKENDTLVELTDNGVLQLQDTDGSDEEVFQTDPDSITSSSTLNGATDALGTLTINALGEWDYSIANAYVEYLGEGETATETFIVRSEDGTEHTVVITIEGTNDVPTIVSGTFAEGVEDQGLVGNNIKVEGNLVIDDPDANENTFQVGNGTADITNTLGGSLVIAADGSWTYLVDNQQTAIQSLDVGDSITEKFTVLSEDGTPIEIEVKINGAEDQTFITDYVQGSVKEEDSTPTLSHVGNLTATDADVGESQFDATRVDTLTNSNGITSLGSVSITSTGTWTYTIDNNLASVQQLGAGDSFTERFRVYSIDGSTSQIVEVVVNGTNDGASISGGAAGTVVEDITVVGNDLQESGSLQVSDIDSGENIFSTTVTNVADATDGLPLGSITITPEGNWTYLVDKDNVTVQALGLGETRTERFQVTSIDGTATQEIVVTIHGTNDLPTVSATSELTGKVFEDSDPIPTATGTLVPSDVDVNDSHTWGVVGSTSGAYGTLALDSGTGVWTYSLVNSSVNHLQTGEKVYEYFQVQVSDGKGGIGFDTVTVEIEGTNDDPSISGDNSGLVIEDGGALSVAKGNLEVADDDLKDTHDWAVVDGDGLYGTLTVNDDGEWTYTLDQAKANFMEEGVIYAEDPFTITVDDGFGGTDSYVVNVNVEGNNDAPDIRNVNLIRINEDTGNQFKQGRLRDQDPDENEDHTWTILDANGNPLAVENGVAVGVYGNMSLVENPLNGRVFWRYDLQVTDDQKDSTQALERGQREFETFTIQVTDKYGATDTQVLQVRVTGTNDQPQIEGTVEGTVTEDDFPNGDTSADIVTSGTLQPGDVDTNDKHTWSIDTNTGDYGTIVISSDPVTGEAIWTYTLNNNNPAVQALRNSGETLTETFEVTVIDDSRNGNPSSDRVDTQEITVIIEGSNDAPILSGEVTGSVIEPVDKDPNSEVKASGALAVSDIDTTDSHSFSVDSVNVDDTDPNQGEYGSLTVDANGVWTYTLNNALDATKAIPPGTTETDSFTVTVTDVGGLTSEVVVNISVAGTNNDPDISASNMYSVVEDGDALEGRFVKGTPTADELANGDIGTGDLDSGDDATWSIVRDGQYGSFTVNADGTWTYTLYTLADVSADPSKRDAYNTVNALAEGESLPSGDTVELRVTDEFGMTSTEVLNIDIIGANDAPVIGGLNKNFAEDNLENGVYQTSGQLTDGDVDTTDNTHTWTLVDANNGLGDYGVLVLNEDGSWTYQVDPTKYDEIQALNPEFNQKFTDTFEVKVTDGFGGTATDTVTINITADNDIPEVTGGLEGAYTEDDGGVVEGQMIITDLDTGVAGDASDDDTPEFLARSYTGAFGTLVVDVDGKWTYTPDDSLLQPLAEGEVQEDKFVVLARDDNGATITEELVIDLTGKNDRPTIDGEDEGTVIEDGTEDIFGSDLTRAEGQLFASDVDNDSPSRNWSLVGGTNGDTNATSEGTYGTLSLDNNGKWVYTLDNESPAVQDLVYDPENPVTETFKVVVTDNVTDSDTNAPGISEELTITINVFGQDENGGSGGGSADFTIVAEVKEDGTADQPIDKIDEGITENSSNIVASSIAPTVGGFMGTLVVDSDDPTKWRYVLDNDSDIVQGLEEGDVVTEVWRFTTDDGMTHRVEVTIHGSADKPEIYVGDTELVDDTVIGEVIEQTVTSTSGRLSVEDPDNDEQFTWGVFDTDTLTGGSTATGGYGQLVIDPNTGEWTYQLNPGVSIPVGTELEETFRVSVTDSDIATGEALATTVDTHDIKIRIVGTAQNVDNPIDQDVPLIVARVSATEDDNVADSQPDTVVSTGTLSVDDVVDSDNNGVDIALGDTITWTLIDGSSPYGSMVVDETTGDWTFTLDNDSNAVQSLREGEVVSDTFEVYAIDQYGKTVVDDNGVPQTLQIIVDVTGLNDAPVASSFVESLIVDTDTGGTPPALNGQLSVNDIDDGDTHSWDDLQPVTANPDYGTLVVNSDGTYQFELTTTYGPNGDEPHPDIVALNEGEQLPQQWTVIVTDGAGATATQTLNLNLVGTNELPEITTTTSAVDNSISEPLTDDADQTPSIVRDITLTDADNAGTLGDNVTLQAADLNGTYGQFVVDPATETWSYQLYDQPHVNALAEGVKVTETFVIRAQDEYGAEVIKSVEIEVVGTNDQPSLEGKVIGTVVDSPNDSVTGQLVVSDPDIGDTHTFAFVEEDASLGSFTIDNEGNWEFTIDSDSEVVNNLPKGETMQTTISVTTTDLGGSGLTSETKDIVITIVGTNDAPAIKDVDVQRLTENVTTTLTGQFDSGDLDNNADGTDGSRLEDQGATDSDDQTWEVIDSDDRGILTVNASTGAWEFELVDPFEELSNGETLDTPLQYTVKVTDEFGLSSEKVVEFQVTGTNDAPSIVVSDTTAVGTVYEDPTGSQEDTANGVVAIDDIDQSDTHSYSLSSSSVVTEIDGMYGTLKLVAGDTADSVKWVYELDQSKADALNTGQQTEQFEVYIESLVAGVGQGDTISQTINVTVEGNNDAAVVTTGSVDLTETDAVLTATGTLTSTDVDNPDNTFTPQSNVSGTYGTFSIDGNGVWNFTANSTFDELSDGQEIQDVFNVTSIDGTPSTVTVNITGTNDAATVSSADVEQDETDAALTITDTLTSNDVDNANNTFTPQTGVVGSHGTFSINAGGTWTFIANQSFDYLNVNQSVSESFPVTSVDGTTSSVTVKINGTNDAADISAETITLDETDSALTASGTLTASDVDNTDDKFIAQTDFIGTIGTFSIDENGAWNFTANSEFNSRNVNQTAEESFTVTSLDGTTSQVNIIIKGTNDAATVSSADVNVQETDAPLSTGGVLTATDVDNADNTFIEQTNVVGNHGTFSIDGNGSWSYIADESFDSLNVGDFVDDQFNVQSSDGTISTVKVTIQGTNDAPTISGDFTAGVQEGVTDTTSGNITVADVDTATPISKSLRGGSLVGDTYTKAGTYGTLTFNVMTGVWAYVLLAGSSNALEANQTADDTFYIDASDGGLNGNSEQPITITVTGNQGLRGDSATNDILVGTADDEWLFGNDIPLLGGVSTDNDSQDTFKWETAALAGTDTVKDFDVRDFTSNDPAVTHDVVDLTSVDFKADELLTDQLSIQEQSGNTVIEISDSGALLQSIVLEGVTLTSLLGVTQLELDGMTPADVIIALHQSEQLTLPDQIVVGDNTSETLLGSAESDIIFGGGGNDILTGGDGHDLFLFTEDSAGTTLNPATSTVTDFSVGDDLLDISDLLPEHNNLGELLGNISVTVNDDINDANDATSTVISVTKGNEQTDITLDGVGWSELGISDANVINDPAGHQVDLISQLDTMNIIKVDL
ncbi:VCBS domain-containing protein, partial [Vibrio methylphosphonaticus]|uniref:VCBS domain-containing protein n=1 Tax=Vibrio methylphosphonaticus TaxID=2946866 RepID=UPI002029D2C0